MVRLTIIWKNITFSLKYNLHRSLVLSILKYVCEFWTLNFTTTKKIQGFDNKAHIILGINYKERNMIILVGYYEPLLKTMKRRKMVRP